MTFKIVRSWFKESVAYISETLKYKKKTTKAMINFTQKDLSILQDICQKWQVEYPVISNNDELFSVLVRIRHEMLRAIPTMNLEQLQNLLSKTEFVGEKMTEVNNALVEEEKLTKELRVKCVKNLSN